MYSLMRTTPTRTLLTRQLPTFAASLAVAEALYKFGSFSLEAIAFLGTWYLLDYGVQRLRGPADSPSAKVEGG